MIHSVRFLLQVDQNTTCKFTWIQGFPCFLCYSNKSIVCRMTLLKEVSTRNHARQSEVPMHTFTLHVGQTLYTCLSVSTLHVAPTLQIFFLLFIHCKLKVTCGNPSTAILHYMDIAKSLSCKLCIALWLHLIKPCFCYFGPPSQRTGSYKFGAVIVNVQSVGE